MKEVEMQEIEIAGIVRAIVQFGPATPTSGFRGGEYFQCVIDPNMLSPGGDFIRFDVGFQGGELHGWQRVEALTVCEVLGEAEPYKAEPQGYKVVDGAKVLIRAIS